MDQTMGAPAPDYSHSKPESTMLPHHSYRDLHETSLLGQTSVAPPPAAGRESFKLHQSPHHATHHNATTAAPVSSLYGSYLPGPQSRSSLGSSLPLPSRKATQDINVASVANALRDAKHFEELARSQRATAHALALQLQQRVPLPLQLHTTTSTVMLVDDLLPEDGPG